MELCVFDLHGVIRFQQQSSLTHAANPLLFKESGASRNLHALGIAVRRGGNRVRDSEAQDDLTKMVGLMEDSVQDEQKPLHLSTHHDFQLRIGDA